MPSFPGTGSTSNPQIADVSFVCVAAFYSWLILQGIVPLSGNGAIIDSDLQTYAQGMAGAAKPWLFQADPALRLVSPANSIPNLERWLGGLLAPGDAWATGLLKAGCLAIFVFLCGWYLLGRWLYGAPVLAALLAVVCSITVWTGWGTFWGVLHSDPVPRVFFSAVMPFLLLLLFLGLKYPGLRPFAALLTGCSIWIHGVSAINCGAMLLSCYLFIPCPDSRATRHFGIFCACVAAFLLPVLIFLWPSLIQGHKFSEEEISIFKSLFALRWQQDYGHFARRLLNFVSPKEAPFPILASAIVAWLAILIGGKNRVRILCKVVPACCFGIIAVALASWAESSLAPKIGRLPMGHELVRGLRFLIPLSWLLIVGGVGVITGKWLRKFLLALGIALVAFFSQDRQHYAAIYALQNLTGMNFSEEIALEAGKSAALFDLFKEVGKIVPEGEAIYCPVDAMQVRYISGRPLIHSFKDGYIFFYNKDVRGSEEWLKLEKVKADSGIAGAWELSGAPWLLCPADVLPADGELPGQPALERDGWILIRKGAE